MAVSKRLRYEIMRRDNHACRYCGATAPDVALTVDHVIPKALGGSDDPTNLVTACKDCNAGKSASSPDAPIVADVAANALRWGAAMEYAAQIKLREAEDNDATIEWFDELWLAWRYGDDKPIPRPAGWENSVLRWLAAGIPHRLIADAVQTAMTNTKVPPSRTWRYFCGICWRLLSEMQEIAHAYLEVEEEGERP